MDISKLIRDEVRKHLASFLNVSERTLDGEPAQPRVAAVRATAKVAPPVIKKAASVASKKSAPAKPKAERVKAAPSGDSPKRRGRPSQEEVVANENAVMKLLNRGVTNPSKIAENTGFSPQTTNNILKRLVGKGLVSKGDERGSYALA